MKGPLDFGQNGRGQIFEERFRAERVFLVEIEDKGEGGGFHRLDESVKRLRWKVKKGAAHDRLFVQACDLNAPSPQVKEKLGMYVLVGSYLVALLGMLVVGESLDLVPCESQDEILKE